MWLLLGVCYTLLNKIFVINDAVIEILLISRSILQNAIVIVLIVQESKQNFMDCSFTEWEKGFLFKIFLYLHFGSLCVCIFIDYEMTYMKYTTLEYF